MQIDWLTVTAQIVNFLILVWLLKRFLYRPVIDAMARREERIAARLEEAQQREREAEARSRDYGEKATALEQARDDKLAEAREEAQREQRRLLDEARREIDKQREKWREELRREQDDFHKALQRELAESVVVVSRRALSSLADAALERQIVTAFLHRLESLSKEEREPFARASEGLHLTTSFELDDESRERVREVLGVSGIEYVRDPELVCGIALTRAGHKLEWNVAAYLEDLERRVRELLAAPAAKRRAAA